MAELLSNNHLLTLFLVVGLGAMIGAIRIGPIRLGAAGVLFVGLIVSAAYPGVGQDVAIVQQIGLAFFVYSVGIAAGPEFLNSVRQQFTFLTWAAIICLLGALIAVLGGHFLNLPKALTVGVYTGSLTAAPALDAASRLTEDPQAAVGYSLAYPMGVIVGLVIVSAVATRKWNESNDTPSLASTNIKAATVLVERQTPTREITEWLQQHVRLSYLRRDGKMRVVAPGEDLLPNDEVIVVGYEDHIHSVATKLGHLVDTHLAHDRSEVAFERVIVSNPALSGRSIADLNLIVRFGAMITRVRRGDLDLLARDDLILQVGDHVAVVVPVTELENVQEWFGDSEKRVAEVDAMAIGLGMVLGMALGAVPFPLPGGQIFQLGTAAGPLLIGLFLGALRRTGPLVWTLPPAASMPIRLVGIMLFLGALGLVAGPDLAATFTTTTGLYSLILATIIVTVCLLLQTLAGRTMGLSSARTAGALAGFLGQPAVLQAAEYRVADERVASAYATLFAFTIIVKIFLVPLIVTL